MSTGSIEAFMSWFQSQGGAIDAASMGVINIPNHGRGAVALRDIPEGHTLFTIPRSLILSMRTSVLPGLFGKKAWKQYGLNSGWVGLILCMMWEEARGPSSKWSEYLSILPSTFGTPMFWTETELAELRGTSVVEKIGKVDAERDFHEKMIPAVHSRPDLFPPEVLHQHYTLDRYHIMGSRILSRSFHVEQWKGEDEDADADTEADREKEVTAVEDAMEVDELVEDLTSNGQEDASSRLAEELDSEDDEDEDIEDPADISMVPMADMLNAKFESENAKLFYEKHDLKMVTTKAIETGQQIWNTYGDPPNSDLLRKYGHVDVVALRPPLTGEGNPGDIVEVRADLVVEAASKMSPDETQERVDWWLELADDDTFVLMTNCELPEEFISLVRLLLLPKGEWDKMRTKSKLPKAKVDHEVLSIALKVLEKRLGQYPDTVEADEVLLQDASKLPINQRNAVIVRLGEKRILRGTIQQLQKSLAQETTREQGKKRKNDDRRDGHGKKIRLK